MSTPGVARGPRTPARSAIQITSLTVGVVFLVVGAAGFVPGLTTDLESLQFSGHDSQAMLFGIFQVSILHNIVHLAFGVAGVLFAVSHRAARWYLIGGGIFYIAVWVYGLFAAGQPATNVLPVNTADNWLHAGLAVLMILLGFFVGRDRHVQHERAERAKPERS